MRLAFVLHNYFPYGGLQRDAWRIAQACKKQGHQVEFITMDWQGEQDPEMPVHIFLQKHWLNYRRYQEFEDEIQPFIVKRHYDGVIGFNKMRGLDFYYAADPCFAATQAQRKWAAFYRWLPRYRYFLNVEAAMCAPKAKTQLLLISPQAAKDFREFYHIDETRLHFLPPGISRDRCWQADSVQRRIAMRERLQITPEQKLILMLGSGFKTKGVDRGIRAFSALPDELRTKSRLLIVGKSDPEVFMQLAEQLGVQEQVQFMLGSDEVPDLLFSADLLLHTAYLENTGTVILEAIVAGLPVLATENCGYAFYIEQAKAGDIVPMPFSQQSLNQKLETMLTSEKYSAWHAHGIKFGQEEDVYSMPERVVELINRLL
ncbi:MAG: glycosyltransferase family 4 protein [Gammaproteobacteria bacterium]